MLATNQILQNRYRIVRQLGFGGMGAVYEANDERLGSTVALKEILVELDTGENIAQQGLVRHAFDREAKILANLHHEAFPRVTDYFSEQDRQFLVMELIHGDDLGELLEKRRIPFPLEDVLKWTDQLLDALDYLHTQNPPILHRDIKPQNLKITARGRIKLLDFGIAKGEEYKTKTTLTNPTFVAASLYYSPIEQIFRVLDSTFRNVIEQGHRGKAEGVSQQSGDARSDLFALGATLYHLMTAQVPVDALKRTLETWSGNSDILPNPSQLNPAIPPEISHWLLKAMAIERENRFSSAKEMHQAFRQIMAAAKRREDDARQAALAAQQSQLEQARQIENQRRLEAEEEEKRRAAEALREAELQRRIAEERAREAERRLSQEKQNPNTESAPPNATQLPTVSLGRSDFSNEVTLGDFQLPEAFIPKPTGIEDFKPEKKDFTPETKDFVPEKTEFVPASRTEPSYPVAAPPPPEIPNGEIGLKLPVIDNKKNDAASEFNFKLFWLLPIFVVGLLAIFGVIALILVLIIPPADNSNNQSSVNISVSDPTPTPIYSPTPVPTISPDVTPTAEPTVTVTPTPLPTSTNPASNRDKSTPTVTPTKAPPTPTRTKTPPPLRRCTYEEIRRAGANKLVNCKP